MPALGPYPGADYEQMVRDLMQVLSTGESLRPDQPYTSRDSGTKYRSGEVTSDVGLLDPVELLAGLLASKGASLLRKGGRTIAESAPPSRDFAREAAEKIGKKRAAQEAEDAANLARRQQEIDAAFEERFRQYRSSSANEGRDRFPQSSAPNPQTHRTVELGTRRTAPLPENQPGTSQDYADIIRKLFEREGQ